MRPFLALCLLLLATACEDEWVWPMEEEALVGLLVDMHLAEAAANNLHGSQKDSIIQLYYNQVFRIHGIDSTTFNTVYDKLEAQPELFEHVYETVVEEIGKREAERTKLAQPKPKEGQGAPQESTPDAEE